MSITTPMSCSISTIVVPYCSFTSSTKRHMSCFSSTFMPAIGSSRSRSVGSAASARARAVGELLAARAADPDRLLDERRLHLEVAPGHDVVEDAHALEQRDVLERA